MHEYVYMHRREWPFLCTIQAQYEDQAAGWNYSEPSEPNDDERYNA